MGIVRMHIVVNEERSLAPVGITPLIHHGNFYHHVLSCLAYPLDSPPVGDLLRRYHGLDGQWLVASPIFWQATHNDAMIVSSGDELNLSEKESRRWFVALAEFVAADNINLHYHDAHTWLLQYDARPLIFAKPVYKMHHQSMMPALKALDKTLFWQRFITENQMFFSGHVLNKARIGLHPINGLWIWGGGQLRERVDTPMYCAGSLAKLASLVSINVNDLETTQRLAKNGVVLLKSLSADELLTLQTRLQKYTTHWYWNNVAYLSKPKSFMSRLMGRL